MPVKRARAPAANLSDSTASSNLKVFWRVFCHISFYKRTPTISWSSFKSKADRNGSQNRVKNCPNSRLNQDLKFYFWDRLRENFLSWPGDSLLVCKEGFFFFYCYIYFYFYFNRWLSIKVHHWATIRIFLTNIWFLQYFYFCCSVRDKFRDDVPPTWTCGTACFLPKTAPFSPTSTSTSPFTSSLLLLLLLFSKC